MPGRIFILVFLFSLNFVYAYNGNDSKIININNVNFSFSPAGESDVNTIIIPFELMDGLIVVKGKINDHDEGNFIIDSGASGLVLNSKYYRFESAKMNQALGLNGIFDDVASSTADSFGLDAFLFKKIDTDIISLSTIEDKKRTKIDGLIGFDILKLFEIQLNYNETFITLSRLNDRGGIIDPMKHTLDKVDSFNFQIANFIPVIEVKIKGKMKKMGIDTGAEVNLLDINRNEDIIENFIPMRRLELSGSEERNIEYIGGKLYRLALGKFKCGGMSTALVNLSSLNKLYKTKLDGIVGYNFLAPWVFSINYKKKMLYIHSFKFVKP